MNIFDEYIEEVNDKVSYGILYTHRAMTDSFDYSIIGTEDEAKVTTILKLKAIEAIRNDIDREYQELKDRYTRLEIEDV